jgi:AAA+ ATPase superfamily predicted ATPase
MPYNPFVTGKMIQNPAHFVGRIRESDDIIAKIRGNNAVSIVGERRIGKSSLLSYLKHVCSVQLLERRSVYLDFMNIETHTLEDFVYLLLGQLRIEFDEDELNKNPNRTLTRKLRQFNIDNQPPIVFLDEFDKIQDLKTLFNDDFLENLRFLCNSGYLCLVTGSKTPLKEMMDKKGLTSPLWNVFTQTTLKEFVVEEALDERSLFLAQYWCAEHNLIPTDAESRFLLSYTSAHPLVMQIVSFNVCQNRYAAVKRSDAQLRDIIAEQTTSHFRSSKDSIRHWLYSSSVTLPKNIEWSSEFIGKVLKNLNPLKDVKIFG